MSRSLDRPQVGGQVGGTKQRVGSLERQLARRRPPVPPYEIPFSLPGLLYISESGKARHPIGGRLVTVDAHLSTAGSTDTELTVKQSGVSIGTLVIGAGNLSAERSFDVIFSARLQTLSVAVTTAGTDAEDLTVFCQFEH